MLSCGHRAMKTHLLVFEMKIKFMQIKYPRFFANRNRQLIEIDRQKDAERSWMAELKTNAGLKPN